MPDDGGWGPGFLIDVEMEAGICKQNLICITFELTVLRQRGTIITGDSV